MTLHHRPRANGAGLSKEDRDAIRDDLVLGLDLIETPDLDAMGVRHLIACLRAALRPLHLRPEANQ